MIKKELREMYLNELSSGWEEERMTESAGGLQGLQIPAINWIRIWKRSAIRSGTADRRQISRRNHKNMEWTKAADNLPVSY